MLLEHLGRAYPEDTRGTILQSLQRPYGTVVFEGLRDQLKRDAASLSSHMLGSFGDAIAANASKANLDDIIDMIVDPRLGWARISIVVRAARWKDERLADAIRTLFRQRSLDWAALRAARLAKLWDLRQEVESYLTHPTADFREEARAYVRAFDKAMQPRR